MDGAERVVWLLLIFLGLLFCAGVACGILSLVLVVKRKHPVLGIILSMTCVFCVSFPVSLTVGVSTSTEVCVLAMVYSAVLIALFIRNRKKIKEEKVSLGEEEN